MGDTTGEAEKVAQAMLAAAHAGAAEMSFWSHLSEEKQAEFVLKVFAETVRLADIMRPAGFPYALKADHG